MQPDVLSEASLTCAQYNLLVASCAQHRRDQTRGTGGAAGRGVRLLRGVRHPLASRSVSPTDGALTVHRLLRSLPLGLLLTCGGFCKMMLLKCKGPFQPFENLGPLWSPARSCPAGWGGLPKWLVSKPQTWHRSLGEGSLSPFWITGCLRFQTYTSPPEGLASTHSAAACGIRPLRTRHLPWWVRSADRVTPPTPECNRPQWTSRFLPPLLCNRVVQSLSASVIVSRRSCDCASLGSGACCYPAPRKVVDSAVCSWKILFI